MQRIAKALSVTHKTISKDLSKFVPEVQPPPGLNCIASDTSLKG